MASAKSKSRSKSVPSLYRIVSRSLGKDFAKLPTRQKEAIRRISDIRENGGPVGSHPITQESAGQADD